MFGEGGGDLIGAFNMGGGAQHEQAPLPSCSHTCLWNASQLAEQAICSAAGACPSVRGCVVYLDVAERA